MKRYYYILTTIDYMLPIFDKETALELYKGAKKAYKSVRLERADSKYGTARVIRQKNNIWN